MTRVDAKELERGKRDYGFDVPGAQHHLLIAITTSFFLTHWFVTDFNIGPPEEKKDDKKPDDKKPDDKK
jgi:hypothetical protein